MELVCLLVSQVEAIPCQLNRQKSYCCCFQLVYSDLFVDFVILNINFITIKNYSILQEDIKDFNSHFTFIQEHLEYLNFELTSSLKQEEMACYQQVNKCYQSNLELSSRFYLIMESLQHVKHLLINYLKIKHFCLSMLVEAINVDFVSDYLHYYYQIYKI